MGSSSLLAPRLIAPCTRMRVQPRRYNPKKDATKVQEKGGGGRGVWKGLRGAGRGWEGFGWVFSGCFLLVYGIFGVSGFWLVGF